jgi:hypothetical protein
MVKPECWLLVRAWPVGELLRGEEEASNLNGTVTLQPAHRLRASWPCA